MFELEICGRMYQFNFGVGFMKNINKKLSTPVDNLPDARKNIGLRYAIAGIIDGEIEQLCEILMEANKNYTPRLTEKELEHYIDEEVEDIDALFDKVLDFLKNSNATKKTANELLELVAAEKAKQAAANQ